MQTPVGEVNVCKYVGEVDVCKYVDEVDVCKYVDEVDGGKRNVLCIMNHIYIYTSIHTRASLLRCLPV